MNSKLCECGCGRQTRIPEYNNRRLGHVAGQPLRFINGHNRATKKPANRIEVSSDGSLIIFLERRNGDILKCFIDAMDYPLVKDFRWSVKVSNHTCYAQSRVPNALRSKFTSKVVRMHNLIRPDLCLVDHRDGDGLNCRRSNLRAATPSQSSMNRGKQANGKTSKYPGVYWDKSKNKFAARIKINRRTIFLGRFQSEEEAWKIREEAAKKLFGEFMREDARITTPENTVCSEAA